MRDEERAGLRTWLAFAAMCVGMFMAILDVQVVATSLPTIQTALAIPREQMSWVQTAYLIAEVVAIPLTGFLIRALTVRGLFLGALAVFTVASAGCAASTGFGSLVVWRVVQGFSGGVLIPAVFAVVFLWFPERSQGVATTLAGVLAVAAPTLGPIVGGWITTSWSWHGLFLINLPVGLAALAVGAATIRREGPERGLLRRLDVAGLIALAVTLAAFEIALKEAPTRGWLDASVLALTGVTLVAGWLFVRRSLASPQPVVDLRLLARRDMAVGCLLSFALGIGLYGSVYLMPVFLAFVRERGPLDIGTIMLVTGTAQLVTAPVAVAMERHGSARLLTACGFLLFALGLGLSAVQTRETDYDGMFWPQIVRGVAIMFCLLPPTRIALGGIEPAKIGDASGLFNLMRNLGGAIGLALIDTVLYGRGPIHAAALTARLEDGDLDAAALVGIPEMLFLGFSGPPDEATRAMLAPLVEKAALVQSINEAWALIALLTLLAVAALPLAGRSLPPGRGT